MISYIYVNYEEYGTGLIDKKINPSICFWQLRQLQMSWWSQSKCHRKTRPFSAARSKSWSYPLRDWA